jgi:type I restriction enzyme R subunit
MESYLSAEDNARVEIDKMLETAGWAVQTRATWTSPRRAESLASSTSSCRRTAAPTTCSLSKREAVGVIEAQPEGATLTGIEWQSAKYLDGPARLGYVRLDGALPFAYPSTGIETRFFGQRR